MTDLLAALPANPTLGGYAPPVGTHVACFRPSDGARSCGIVEENRAGLFLAVCAGGRVVLTAANWWVYASPQCS